MTQETCYPGYSTSSPKAGSAWWERGGCTEPGTGWNDQIGHPLWIGSCVWQQRGASGRWLEQEGFGALASRTSRLSKGHKSAAILMSGSKATCWWR